MALLLTNRPYRLLFSASAISNLGDGISALAFPWLASVITKDPFLISLVAFAQRLPWLLFTLPAGALTDRFDRRTIMVQTDLFRCLLTCGVIAVILSLPDAGPTHALPPILALSALAMLLGTAEVLRDNAAQTILPALISREDLETANGQIWSVEHIMGSFLGPPVAGVLIAYALPMPFAVDAVTFALAAWLVWMIALPPPPSTSASHPKMWPALLEAWRWTRDHPVILQLALILGLINGFSIMGLTVLVLFSQDILGLSAAGHGLLLTAGAAGGVVGGLIGPHIVEHLGPQRAIFGAMVLFPLPFAAIALTSSVWVVAAALFVEMIGALIWNIVTVSYRQRRIPDLLLGRVNAIYRFFGWGVMPFGALAAGALVAALEPSWGREASLRAPYVLCGLGMAAMLIYGRIKLRL